MAFRKWNGKTYKTVREPLTDTQRIAKLEKTVKKQAEEITYLKEQIQLLWDEILTLNMRVENLDNRFYIE